MGVAAYPQEKQFTLLVLSEHPFISCLFGLATHKVYPAMFITKHPVGSYPTISPFPLLPEQKR